MPRRSCLPELVAVARAVLPPALVHTPRGDVIIIDDGQELARTVGAAGTRTEKP